MKGTCSIREVAKRANVAASTVSRVLNNHSDAGRITETTRRKVLAVVEALNYSPNINARRLFSRKTGTIGLLVPSFRKMGNHIFEDSHLIRIISGLEEGFGEDEYSLLMLFNNNDFENKKRYLTLFREQQIDGLLIWGAYENETYWSELVRERYPYIFLTTVPKLDDPINYVASDYEQAGYLAAKHLLEKGHRQIAWIGGDANSSVCRLQRLGCRRAYTEYGLNFELMPSRFGDYLANTGEALAEELLSSGYSFTAAIGANVPLARGVLRTAAKRELAVPAQMAVVGCDSIWDDEFSFRITRVRMPDLEIGKTAAKEIIGLINHQSVDVQLRLPVELLPGQSS